MESINGTDTLEELKRQMDFYQDALHALRVRHNALILVASRLPPEILSTIFYLCVMTYRERKALFSRSSSQANPYRWIALTHVCRRWREVALGNTLLWTNVYSVSRATLNLALVFLQRSTPLPVHMEVKASDKYRGIDTTLLNYVWTPLGIQRVVSLSLQVTYKQLRRLLETPDTMVAPHLRTLEFEAPPRIIGSSSSDPFPNILPKLTAPALATLRVEGYHVHFAAHCFPNTLTSLVIIDKKSSRRSSVPDIVNALRSLVMLQELYLHDVIAPQTLADPLVISPAQIIALPHLRAVNFTASPRSSIRFLDHLKLPADASITITVRGCCDDDDIPLFLPALLAKLSTKIDVDDPKQPIECLEIEFFELFFRKRRLTDVGLAPAASSPYLAIEIYDMNMQFADGAFLSEIAAKLPLADVSELKISYFNFMPVADSIWILVQRLGNVERMTIDGVAGSMTFDQVLYLLRRGLPKLRYIALQNLNFRFDEYGNRPSIEDFARGICAKLLRRKKKGQAVVEEIKISQCSCITQTDIKLLREVVDTVIWDGAGLLNPKTQ
ncbi:hypothetical protein EIP91_009325 [Steccherinum ochraceum]|uniref:F-box domain-containing protein n=1 Tax=Steccherinum ochraceum TaxID=92696 RepID=A0A4R0RRP1_9APHY|nr:hypothetical protein EIP91_009325 [Steccherinum ochraceum]